MIRYLLYNGSINYPYVSRFNILGQDTIKDGTMPDCVIGNWYSSKRLPMVPF